MMKKVNKIWKIYDGMVVCELYVDVGELFSLVIIGFWGCGEYYILGMFIY